MYCVSSSTQLGISHARWIGIFPAASSFVYMFDSFLLQKKHSKSQVFLNCSFKLYAQPGCPQRNIHLVICSDICSPLVTLDGQYESLTQADLSVSQFVSFAVCINTNSQLLAPYVAIYF